MPEYTLRREKSHVTAAGFHYDGVLVLPLAQVPAPKIEQTVTTHAAVVVTNEAPAAPEKDNVVPFPVAAEKAPVVHYPGKRGNHPGLGLLQSRGAQRVAVVAAAAGLVFAAVSPGQGTVEEKPQADDAANETSTMRAQASVNKKIVVPKDAGANMERVAYTTSANKDDQLSEIMAASSTTDTGEVEVEGSAGALSHPVSNINITSRFGMRPDPWTGYGMVSHIGQDYGIACGTEVYAAASGVVTQAEWAGHSGNRVSVDHGNGLVTTYNHNTSLSVGVGDTVERGDVVSLAGTTGNSTGCHLHFEVLVEGTAVDPVEWLPPEQ